MPDTPPVPTTYPVAIATNEKLIADLRARGLIVLDPEDPAVPGRVARALWDGKSERLPMHSAYKVLAALADGTPA
jgi:hypothetical protein